MSLAHKWRHRYTLAIDKKTELVEKRLKHSPLSVWLIAWASSDVFSLLHGSIFSDQFGDILNSFKHIKRHKIAAEESDFFFFFWLQAVHRPRFWELEICVNFCMDWCSVSFKFLHNYKRFKVGILAISQNWCAIIVL